MSTWKDRLKYRLPRLAVILHDLVMVWVCWQGLHYVRYALQPTPLLLAPISSTVLIVLVAQGLCPGGSACTAACGASPASRTC